MAARHKSAIKRHRQSEKRRVYNQSIRSNVKTYIKKVLKAVEGKKTTEAQDLLKQTMKVIDKAAAKGVLHKRNASRKIARLSKRVYSNQQD